jgi:hypothetical protein
MSPDEKSYTEEDYQKGIAKALVQQSNEEQAQVLKTEVKGIKARLTSLTKVVGRGNNLRDEILTNQTKTVDVLKDVATKVSTHHEEIEAINLPNWSEEEKKALQPTVKDFLVRAALVITLAHGWKRKSIIISIGVAITGLLINTGFSIYNALHGNH